MALSLGNGLHLPHRGHGHHLSALDQPLAEESIFHQLVRRAMSKDKRTPDQPTPFRGEFSFVNKDAGNIDSKDHNAAVSWHVMNRYERWKKQEQAKRLRASANVPIGPLSPPSRQPHQQQQQQQQPAPPQPHQQTQPGPSHPAGLQSTPAVPGAVPFGYDPWTAEQPLQLGYPGISWGADPSVGVPTSSTSTSSTHSGIMDEGPSSLLTTVHAPLELGETMFEPSADPSMTPLGSTLVSFAYEVFIPQLWPKDSNRTQTAYELARCLDDVALIHQDPCYANAYLSLLAAAMAATMDDEGLAYQSRYHQGEAMRELRQRVVGSNPVDLITLKAVLKLFSAETLADNTSVARVHLKMLRNLVTAAGGVILTDAWFREDLLSCDCYFALKYETRPLFPAQEWTPGPLSQPWKARLLSARLFGDHAAGVDPLVEHAVMKAVVTDLRELFRAREYTQSHEVPADEQLLRWQQLRKLDCISRIADHYVNLAIYPHLFHRPTTQASVCVATALITGMVLGSPEPVRFGLKLLGDLRKKLRESDAEGDPQRYRRLRLWALYVGSLAEKVYPVGVDDHAWFDSHYRVEAADMGLSGWEDARKLVRQFLYSDKLHQELEAGRPYRTMDARQGLYSASGGSWRDPLQDTHFVVGGSEEELGAPGPGPGPASTSKSAGKRRADDG